MNIIYNVTSKIEPEVVEKWLDFMLSTHIPEVMETSCFQSYRFSRVLGLDESDGPTYTAQYTASNQEHLDQYLASHAARLRRDVVDRFGDKVLAFRTTMALVSEG